MAHIHVPWILIKSLELHLYYDPVFNNDWYTMTTKPIKTQEWLSALCNDHVFNNNCYESP